MKKPSMNHFAIGVVIIAMANIALIACGGDSGSSTKSADDDREVATVVDMGRCTSEREGDTVYVAEKMTDYLCKNRTWVDLNSSSSIDPKSASETSSGKDEVPTQGVIRENISVMGVAQKGPFKFGSPLNLYELKKDLNPSGRVYNDEINSNKGDFVIPKVNLAYPYAKLEVRGLYRNEVTGEWSKDSMTLRALTDFSEKRTEVNINLLTHLEYDRVLYLVQEKGYSVYAAKKQAAQEIMTAFEFATAVTCSEDFTIFQNEGVSIATSTGNATLLAVSALVMGNRSDAEIQSVIDKFREDVKTDGEWNDLQTKADMADWAHDFKYSTIRASVKSWNILDIPTYETYLDVYWNNVYGLGGCSENRKDIVASNSNKLSKYYGNYFICDGKRWVDATTYQKDTYEWNAGKIGEFKKGNVTDTIYVYNVNKWEVAKKETTIGICGNTNAGVVSLFDEVYYICKNNAWEKASILEYDTYGKKCLTDGSIVVGEVIASNKYVCDADSFRVANAQEISLNRGCVNYTKGDKVIRHVTAEFDSIYQCKKSLWSAAIEKVDGYYGTLTDIRDGKTYKTIVIGHQTWMSENLNYFDTTAYSILKEKSWCFDNSADNCVKYGRLYTWAVTMDSVGAFSTKGQGCGYETNCSPTYPVRGICPEGWHVPTSTEWENLYSAMSSSSYAMQAKGYKYWSDATDASGFSALPVGYYYNNEFYNNGFDAFFWSATLGKSWRLGSNSAKLINGQLYYGFSVRCIQD